MPSPRLALFGFASAALTALLLVRPAQQSAPVAREAGLSVLLVTIDTLRADALGSYGRVAAGTPTLDRLAAGGLRFEMAHAQAVVTLPSHVSLLTGRLPPDHGVHDNAGFRLGDSVDTLATLLKRHGYRTGAFVSAFPLDSRFGLARGFDVYDDRLGAEEGAGGFRIAERSAVRTIATALEWIHAQGDAPSFAWVHVYEPHFPYAPPEPFATRFRDQPYQGEVAAADAALEPLLGPLIAAGRRGRTLAVVTADHGESLGEHGEQTHGLFAYEATLRVPLLVFAPRLVAPQVVNAPVRHVDIVPTILDALELPIPSGLAGHSLLPLADGRQAPVEAGYFEALSAARNRGWAPLTGVVRGGLKYVDLPIPELYDLAADPGETRNLAATRAADVAALHGVLSSLRGAEPSLDGGRADAETRGRLASLGYVAAASATRRERYTADDDPKRLIGLDAALQDAIGHSQEGDLRGAITIAHDVLARRPDMTIGWLQLAYFERGAGHLPEAVAAARRALELAPQDADALALAGAYLNEAGRAQESVARLGRAAQSEAPDPAVITAYAIALAQLGLRDSAVAAFDRILALDPSNALTFANRGTVHLLAHDLVRARADFEAALERDPGLARAENALGVIAARQGDVAGARARWERAAQLDPDDPDSRANLATVASGGAPR